MILSIDGGKNIGYAIWSVKGSEMSLLENEVMPHTEFFDPEPEFEQAFEIRDYDLGNGNELFFLGHRIETIVVESIRHNPKISQGGSQRWESQVEGACRMIGTLVKGVEVVYQPASILPVAMIHAGYEKPVTKNGNPKHLPDDDAAMLHGVYYAESKGLTVVM